jgi:hypothetical protein
MKEGEVNIALGTLGERRETQNGFYGETWKTYTTWCNAWNKWNSEKQKNKCVKHRIGISSVWLFLSFRGITFEDI